MSGLRPFRPPFCLTTIPGPAGPAVEFWPFGPTEGTNLTRMPQGKLGQPTATPWVVTSQQPRKAGWFYYPTRAIRLASRPQTLSPFKTKNVTAKILRGHHAPVYAALRPVRRRDGICSSSGAILPLLSRPWLPIMMGHGKTSCTADFPRFSPATFLRSARPLTGRRLPYS